MFSKTLLKAIATVAIVFTGIQAAPYEAGSEIIARDTASISASDIKATSTNSAQAAAVDGAFNLCWDKDFRNGTCAAHLFFVNQCVNLFTPFQDSVSSLGPDRGFNCIVYVDANCSGSRSLLVVNPGIWDLSQIGWNDQISSFRCTRQ